MFRNKVIRKRVMEAIDRKIDEAQKELDIQSETLENRYFKDVSELGKKLETDKEALIETQVNKILGKVI